MRVTGRGCEDEGEDADERGDEMRMRLRVAATVAADTIPPSIAILSERC